MKKLFFKIAFVMVFVLVTGFTLFTSSKSKIVVSTLALTNIEALATDESDLKCKWKRVQNGHGVWYDACLSDGTGNYCVCGTVSYD